jgi:glycosyltransferase involved in cell wall biosynthesis
MMSSGRPARLFVTGLRGFPSVMGGVESHCEQLYPRIRRLSDRWSVTVLARRAYVGGDPYEVDGVRIVPLPSTRGTSTEAIVGTLLSVLEARRRGADLLHIHAIGPALLTPLARLLGLRVVVTHHGEDYARAKWGRFARLMLRAGEAAALRFAHRVIVVAPSLRKRLADAYPAQAAKLDYIPNGTSRLPEQGSQARALLASIGYAPGDYVLTVGRLVPEKAFDTLVAAVRRVPGRRLLVVGGADHESAFSRQLLAQAGPDIVFAGVLDKPTLRDLYLQCGLFVLPSLHEGLPIAALEAGSLGAPLLLSDIPANLDLGLPPHHYVPAGSVEALAERIALPFDRHAIDAEALRRRFDWDEVAAATERLYAALFDGAASVRAG